jgi:hypothetical protein
MYRVRFFRVVAEHSEPDSADMLLATVSHAFQSKSSILSTAEKCGIGPSTRREKSYEDRDSNLSSTESALEMRDWKQMLRLAGLTRRVKSTRSPTRIHSSSDCRDEVLGSDLNALVSTKKPDHDPLCASHAVVSRLRKG